jgi:hypothetical protein
MQKMTHWRVKPPMLTAYPGILSTDLDTLTVPQLEAHHTQLETMQSNSQRLAGYYEQQTLRAPVQQQHATYAQVLIPQRMLDVKQRIASFRHGVVIPSMQTQQEPRGNLAINQAQYAPSQMQPPVYSSAPASTTMMMQGPHISFTPPHSPRQSEFHELHFASHARDASPQPDFMRE